MNADDPETQKDPEGKTAKSKPKKRKKKTKKAKTKKKSANGATARRGRTSFPPVPFSSVLALAEGIQSHGAGQPVRRLTLLEKLDKSPESSASRLLITNSGRYGLTTGSYKAEQLELTDLGKIATSTEKTPGEKLAAQFKLAIEGIPEFAVLYERNKGNRLPSPEVLRDSLAEKDIPEDQRKQCVDIFLENLTYLRMLRTVAGAQRILTLEHALEDLGATSPSPSLSDSPRPPVTDIAAKKPTKKEWQSLCFVIAPIGDIGTEQRKHSDMILEALITRALEGDKYTIVRADQIASPGMISGQVIEHLIYSRLVIADLSFHNPNVFYELAIRHILSKPTVHIIRKEDQIPFDLKDFRTITIDTSDKYDLVAKLDTYRAEIANHVRQAIQEGAETSNPIATFAKSLRVEVT